MITQILRPELSGFTTHSNRCETLADLVQTFPETASFHEIGRSEHGHPIVAVQIGRGKTRISLLAGAHSDEPVGPETLRILVEGLLVHHEVFESLLDRYCFFVIPHVNPDGEDENRIWMESWPDVGAYLKHVFREPPGRDVEFSYPDRRPENQAVSSWLVQNGPFSLHMSMHGMGFSDGAMLLIERNWTYRTEDLQNGFVSACYEKGLEMHDHNRKGEKGFFYIAPGFTTTPEGAAMRTYFQSHDQPHTASLFGDSSMEFVRNLGGDPLCLVTELPLFVVNGPLDAGPAEKSRLEAYLDFGKERSMLASALQRDEDVTDRLSRFNLTPLSVSDAVFLQLKALELGMEAVG